MSPHHEKPKLVELRPNIFHIRSEIPGSHVYLIKGTAKNVLIDTGTASNRENLESCLADVGLGIRDIHLVVLTHEHFDHVGAANYFGTAVIAAHCLAANKIELQDEFVMMSKYLDERATPFHADLWLQGDSVLDLGNYKLHILHTPGHCSGCICLYEPEQRILFTGDTVLAGGVLSGILGSGNVSDYISSLQQLSTLKIDELYPGHGRISLTAEEDLQKALESARSLMEESKALFESLNTKMTYDHYFSALRQRPISKLRGF